MKRSREVTIMLDCLIESGVVSDDADTELMRRSIKEGFKKIREERFEEKLRIGGKTMTNEQKISELKEMCEPIVEYLKRCDPHMEISITQDAIKLKAVEVGIPLGSQ